MPDCDPLVPCVDLDGRILLQRTVYGPQLAFNADAGALASGAGLRPYLDLVLGVSWRPLGLCQGPPTSVMGLAPGEVVSVGIRTRQSRTFSSLVRDAAEASKTSSHSDRHTREQAPQQPPAASGAAAGGGGRGGGSGFGPQDVLGAAVHLAPVIIGLFGSSISNAMTTLGNASRGVEIAKGPSDVSKRMQQMIEQTMAPAGSGGPVLETVSITDDILDTVMRSESESHLRETSVTTSQETETTIKRTFGNPYLDRSLQLRFIPVFNRFEVVTSFLRVVPGLVGHFAEPATTPARLANIRDAAVRASLTDVSARPVATLLHATEAVGDDDATRRPMVQLLQTVTSRTAGAGQTSLEGGLAWERTETRGNGVHVPLAAADNVAAAWGLRGSAARSLAESLQRIAPDRLGAILERRVRTVNVFAGTHVEAVPGSCVLPGIPAGLSVIVPGATQYVKEMP